MAGIRSLKGVPCHAIETFGAFATRCTRTKPAKWNSAKLADVDSRKFAESITVTSVSMPGLKGQCRRCRAIS